MRHAHKHRLITKLISARNELEDALNLSAGHARYDPALLSDTRWNELALMKSDLDRMILILEQSD